MRYLFIHDNAVADLEALWKGPPKARKAAAQITALLDEIEGSQDLLDRLTQHGFGEYETADIHVSRWLAQWNNDRNIWRLKLWNLERHGIQYRVIYAFVPLKHHHHILAVVPRDFDYARDHPITTRILTDYEYLC